LKPLCAAALSLIPFAAEADECGAASAWDIEAYYAGDLWRNLDGGIERGGAYLDSLDVTIFWDSDRALGVKGLSAQSLVLWNNGGSISDKVGDSFFLSNIETVEALRVLEAWAQYAPADPERSLRFGLYDLNTEFDTTDTAALFLNSTFGIGVDVARSGVAGPSIFPLTALGVHGQWRFDEGWRAQAVLLDGVPGDPDRPARTAIRLSSDDGVLGVMELERDEGGRVWVVGHWRYSAEFDELAATLPDGSPQRSRDNAGTYAFVEMPLAGPIAAGREASAVLRIGRADPHFNGYRDTVQAAIVWQGGPLRREGEVFGVGLRFDWRLDSP
jgi:porin